MAGPKKAITAAPLDFSSYPEDRAARRIQFIHEHVVTPRGHGAGEPMRLREWQQDIVRGVYADGIEVGLVSMPRGNGKSGLAAALALAEVFVGPLSAEALIVASDERQARIIFDQACRMVALNPELADRVHIFKDRLYVPHTDSAIRPLPADWDALQGWDPTLQLVDEMHVVTEDVFEAVSSAMGKRPEGESRVLAISTPGRDQNSVMHRMVMAGRRGDDPSLYLREFMAPEGCALDDRGAWRAANPALGDFLSERAIEASLKTLREPVFRQLRLGLWAQGISSWAEWGSWEPLADPGRVVEPGTRVALGFDGSASGDHTVIVGATIEPEPHLFVVGHWFPPEGKGKGWRVPRDEVDAKVREAFETWRVVELSCDPWGYRSEVEAWQKRHGQRRVVEYNTGYRKRFGAAVDRMYQAIAERGITHDGNEALREHVYNAVAKETTGGTVIEKASKGSPKKIDLLVGAVIALDRAAHHSKKGGRVAVLNTTGR